MEDHNERGSDSDKISSRIPVRIPATKTLILPVKTCCDCGTSKTPLWRTGPTGPKSLCNACGIRSRKRRNKLLGLIPKVQRKRKSKKSSRSNSTVTSDGSSSHNSEGDSSSKRVGGSASGLVFEDPKLTLFEAASVLGEVEQAAMLLIAMSCDSNSVF